jgi:AmmeMemoRadiSam system protein A
MHPYVELAKTAVEEYVRNRRMIEVPANIPEDMRRRAGVFICLKKHGRLRGCIGTYQPCCANLYEEIVRNSLSASAEDPRFSMVTAAELDDITYTVDVLSEPKHVKNKSELDPKKYGVIVAKIRRRGLLLPDLEGVDTVEEQLRIVKMKAGIDPLDEDVEIFKFTVDRYA